ncbi:MAG: toprim domain-containing protein [Gammaproteobacteria bacterium]|nr:toprim domain-containing protein [Gammaproteobacteria bacterium]
MNASAVAAELARRAEAVCRRYLPHGRRQGRYWVAGDLDGARGRSLYVRLEGPGAPGKFTDAATGQHGDLLDIVRIRSGAPTLRAALAEARAFLALPAAPAMGGNTPYDSTEAARRLWARCRALAGTHAEKYLLARGLALCRFAALRFHPELRYREGHSVIRLPALVAAVTGDDGAVTGVQRTWLDPRSPAKAGVASPRKALGRIYGHAVRFGTPDETLLVGEGIETVLSLVTAVPDITAAAALSAGSLGAFAPPPGVGRLVIARDNDPEGDQAAECLARRCARSGVGAAVLVPEGGDFNDDLLALGPEALAARLAPLVRFAAEGERRGRW